jgi:hypothetical protein
MRINWTKSLAYSLGASIALTLILSILIPPQVRVARSQYGVSEVVDRKSKDVAEPFYREAWNGMTQQAAVQPRSVYVWRKQSFPCEQPQPGNHMDGFGNYYCLERGIN